MRKREFAPFSNGLLASLESIFAQPLVPSVEKLAVLQLAVAVVVDQALQLVDCGKFRTLAEKIGDNVVSLLTDRDVLPRELFRLARHDFTSFAHVTNVASYCVMLRKKSASAIQSNCAKWPLPRFCTTSASGLFRRKS